MKKFAIIIFILSLNTLLYAQTQTIRGTIIDKNTRTTLVGANVVLLGNDPIRGGVTDIDGKFRIEKAPVGRANLKVTFLGYNDISLSNLELNSGKELILNLEMEEKVTLTKEVVITAQSDKSATQNQMTSVSSRGFTVEETGRYAGSRGDVGRMAANYAGVKGASDARNDIIIRGNSPSGLLWRLEGVDIPSPNHWSGFGTTGGPVCMLNNNLMSNSDFLTGAFPSEYGNALSGVFDLKMRNGNNEKHEFLGQIGFNGFEFGAEGPISRKNGSSYLINFRYSTLEAMQKLGMNFGTGTGVPKYKDMSFKINLPKTKLGSFSIFGLGGLSDIKMLSSIADTTKENFSFYNSDLQDITSGSNTAIAGITHTYIINNTTYIKTIASVSYHNALTLVDSVSRHDWNIHAYYRSNFQEYKVFGTMILNKKINTHHNIKSGVILSKMYFDLNDSIYIKTYNKFFPIHNFDGNTYLVQPYTQWQYKITDDIILNTGFHFLFLGLNHTSSIEPRIGLKWFFLPTHSISIAYGRHSMINPITIYFTQSYNNDSTQILKKNKDLGMTHSQHFVLAYDWIIKENMRFKTELYYQLIDNAGVDADAKNSYSILNQGANFGVWSPEHLENKGTGYNYGIELTLERFLSKGFYYLITGSLFDSRYKGSDGVLRNTTFNGMYACNLLVGKEFVLNGKNENRKNLKKLGIDLKTTRSGGDRFTPLDIEKSRLYQSEQYLDDQAYSKQLPDYWKTDIKIAFKINGKRLTQEWALDITNLFNQKNVLNQRFDKKTGDMSYNYQMGLMVMPMWRITF